MNPIYLDHNSTTPLDPAVIQAMLACMKSNFVNPASQHQPGQQARQVLERYRHEIASMLDAKTTGMATDSLVFTSGGTESNNLGIIGLVLAARKKCEAAGKTGPFCVFISAVEHPSVMGAADHLSRTGVEIIKIPVDQNGIVQPEVLEQLLEAGDKLVLLVSVMVANNETGVIQPVQNLVTICQQHQVLFHTDAVQAVGKIPVSFQKLGVDALSFTAHKLNGPKGIGGLIVRSGVQLLPTMYGGFQQMGLRPGTEDLVAVSGLHQALKLFVDQPDRMDHVEKMRDQLESDLAQMDRVVVVGNQVQRVPHTLNLAFCGVDRQSILLAADMVGLAISTGSACASGSSEPSSVLLAMGLSKEVVEGSIRISLGVSNTEAELVEAFRRISNLINDLRNQN